MKNMTRYALMIAIALSAASAFAADPAPAVGPNSGDCQAKVDANQKAAVQTTGAGTATPATTKTGSGN